MRQIYFEKIDLHLSNIGLGTLAIGGPLWDWGWGPQDDNTSIKTIHAAFDLGINWIDTAAVYGLGHSEEIIGKAIKPFRNEFFISTKCGQVWDSNGEIRYHLKGESIREEIEASLRRLGVEQIDLYQIHWPIPDKDIEEAWGILVELINEGKVKLIGVSNFNVSQLKRVNKIYPVFSNQILYNMFDREIENKILPFCKENGVSVFVYSPMASGLLTGKYNKKGIVSIPANDWRKSDKGGHFLEPELHINFQAIEELSEIAEKLQIKLSQLALAWILNNKSVSAPIVGARNKNQISETAKASSIEFSEDICNEINNILKKRSRSLEDTRE